MPTTPPPVADGPRILVSGWAGAGNVGDELLTMAIIDRLRRSGAGPVIASQDPARTSELHGVDSVRWGPRGLGALRGVDGVCVGPGGILQDSSSLWSLPGHLAVALAARRQGLPVASIGVGAEPLRRRSSSWLLRRALGGRPVVTRDEPSSQALRQAGLEVVTGADLVFGLEHDHRDVTPAAEIVVSVGGGVRPGLLSPASRRIEAPPIGEIAAALDHLADAMQARVVLTRFRGERDAATAAQLQQRLAADSEVLSADVDEHVRRVRSARLVVSSRYHPVVLAATAGVPAIVVSEQLKVQALVDQLARPSIRRSASWAEAAQQVPPVADDTTGSSSEGLERTHDALERLVAEAGAPRGERSGG